jgi:uncharacterized protein (DUF1697 family)
MSDFIALLRGVNVGGNGKVPMADLRALMADMGFENPRTVLQSGNLVIGAQGKTTAEALEKKLHTEIAKAFKVNTELFVRTPAEWSKLVKENPFETFAAERPSAMLVWVMREKPDAKHLKALMADHTGPEEIESRGRRLYVTFPDGQGDSRLAARGLLDKHMPSRGTGRNWNTVLKLQAMVT